MPSLDIVRVEPSGDTVIAGRGLPNASVELLRDNQPVARAVADETGQFAIVPPPLPPGSSAITLRATLPDGKVVEGRESVAVVVAQDRRTQPLVAVSEPDKPTRVLSQPQAPAQAGDQAKGQAKEQTKGQAKTTALDKDGRPAAAEASVPVRIVSVDAQDGGRLFVSGQGAAWSSLRLYLNDTLVASGRSGADGRVAFTIGRGVRAGTYQVRIDQVEGESGKVRNRAQVAFAFPAQLAAKEAQEPAKDMKVTEHRSTADRAGDKPGAATRPDGTVAAGEATVPDAAGPASPPGVEAKADPATTAPAPSSGPSPASPVRPSDTPATLAEGAPSASPRPGDQPSTVFIPEIDTARIVRGDSLWQISRRTYGDGKRYTVIYDANREQIRDPDLIYPGQIFVMPKDTKDVPAAAKQGARRG